MSLPARRPSRVQQINQITNAKPTFTMLRASGSASSSQGPSPRGSDEGTPQDTPRHSPTFGPCSSTHLPTFAMEASDSSEPAGAESPQFSALSRAASAVSLTALAASGQPSSRARATTLDVPGLTRSKVSPDGHIAKVDVGAKLVIVMVGLPARGKSYITKKLTRFLNWQQYTCRIFNVGNTRRRAGTSLGPAQCPLPDVEEHQCPTGEHTQSGHEKGGTQHTGDFFNPNNPATVAMREQWAYDTLHELLDYVLDGEGSVGILDATNTTIARRRVVKEIIKDRSQGDLKVLFLESICSDPDIIMSNVKLKLSGPDYKHMDEKAAIEDFMMRLHNYEKAYETIGPEEEADPDFQYIKMINVGQKVECGNIKGFLAGQTVFFLLNFNLADRQIWITRHGESKDNQKGRIGGDAGLTERGRKFSQALSRFITHKKAEFRNKQLTAAVERLQLADETPDAILPEAQTIPIEPERNFCVWTSMLRRAADTGAYFDENEFDVKEMRMLNELDAGICDGMTYAEIKEKHPEEYKARMGDKLRYRYPGVGGESYLDVINRLRPVIVEMERMEDNCLVICHRVVARVLLAYFMNLGREAIGDLEVPLHTVWCLEPKPYGVEWALYKFSERFNWFFKVPKEAAAVQEQLRDHKRRYTVVPTAGLPLGDCRESVEGIESGRTNNALESSTSGSDQEGDEEAVAEAEGGTAHYAP